MPHSRPASIPPSYLISSHSVLPYILHFLTQMSYFYVLYSLLHFLFTMLCSVYTFSSAPTLFLCCVLFSSDSVLCNRLHPPCFHLSSPSHYPTHYRYTYLLNFYVLHISQSVHLVFPSSFIPFSPHSILHSIHSVLHNSCSSTATFPFPLSIQLIPHSVSILLSTNYVSHASCSVDRLTSVFVVHIHTVPIFHSLFYHSFTVAPPAHYCPHCITPRAVLILHSEHSIFYITCSIYRVPTFILRFLHSTL